MKIVIVAVTSSAYIKHNEIRYLLVGFSGLILVENCYFSLRPFPIKKKKLYRMHKLPFAYFSTEACDVSCYGGLPIFRLI